MSYQIANIVNVRGNLRRISEMLLRIQNDEAGLGSFDFNKVIPMPETVDYTYGTDHNEAVTLYKEFCWLRAECMDKPQEQVLATFRTEHPGFTDEVLEEGQRAVRNTELYGAPDWRTWAMQNWGTEYNAYDFLSVETDAEKGCEIGFCTKNHPAEPVIKMLAVEYPDLWFEHFWLDEEPFGYHGRKTYFGGCLVTTELPETDEEIAEFVRDYYGDILAEEE